MEIRADRKVWSIEWRGDPSPLVFKGSEMAKRVLSIFFDESGDQGLSGSQSPFYILSMVFHDQSHDISSHIHKFDSHLQLTGLNDYPIHTGPLIRKEFPYENLQMEIRKRLFASLFNFMRKAEVKYGVISFEKKIACSDSVSVADALEKKLNEFLLIHKDFFHEFDKIIGYYDNGQKYLSTIIGNSLKALPIIVEMRKSSPAAYRLGQAADMVCTMELLNIKTYKSMLGQSELDFFGGKQKLKKDYLKQFKKYAI